MQFLIDADEWSELARAGEALLDVQTKLLRAMVADLGRDGVLDRFGVPAAMRRFVDWEELLAPAHLVARFDIVPTASGYQFCELNVDSCVAGAEIYEVMIDQYTALGIAVRDRLDLRAPLEDYAALLAEQAHRRGASRVVLLDWSVGGGSAGKGYFSFETMRRYVAAAVAPIPVVIADEQTYDPAWLEPGTLAFRGFMMHEMDDEGRFLDRLLAAGTMLVNTYEGEVRSNKAWCAIFHAATSLDDAERELIARYIPPTIEIDEQNLAEVVEQRAAYVFKPKQAFGGSGILFGDEHGREALRAQLVAQGLHTWTAQRVIPAVPIAMPLAADRDAEPANVVLGLYRYGARTNSMLVRASSQSRVVNVTAGHACAAWAAPATPAAAASLLAAFDEDDAQLAAVMADLDANPWPTDFHEARALYDKMGPPIPDDIARAQATIGHAIAHQLIPPSSDPARAILFLHGGGYVYGSLASHGGMVAEIARAAGCAAWALEYRLAPESPFPAALDDALAAYEWLLARHDPRTLAVVGDSAGGGLAISLLVALRDAGRPLPAVAACVSPWVDLEGLGETYRTRQALDPMIDHSLVDELALHYLGDRDRRDPAISPIHADLRGLPPLLVQVGEREVLHSEVAALVARARAAGVEVVFEEWPRMVHVWHLFCAMLDAGKRANERIGQFVKERTT